MFLLTDDGRAKGSLLEISSAHAAGAFMQSSDESVRRSACSIARLYVDLELVHPLRDVC